MKCGHAGFLVACLGLLTVSRAEDHPWEWAGIFETPESDYMWTSQKVESSYADPSLTMVAWPVTTFTEETLHGLEEQAEAAMNMTCTDVQAGGTIVPASNACFRLVFQQILAANFFSGTSVLIGTAVVLSAEVDDSTIGLILAFGGGVYLHLGATDCLPKLYDPKLTFVQRLAAFSAFILGAILIGLILIGHEHCVPEGSAGHGGHGDAHGDAHGGH
eukprot:Skav226850  [mRNA]  locus=scaffold455:66018:67620:+ [translate_table: standard]